MHKLTKNMGEKKVVRLLRDMEGEMIIRNYSFKTQKTYMYCIEKYLAFDDEAGRRCSYEMIKRFLVKKADEGVGPVSRKAK